MLYWGDIGVAVLISCNGDIEFLTNTYHSSQEFYHAVIEEVDKALYDRKMQRMLNCGERDQH